ncbi:EF-hand domain-containing protein [Actinokineospora sp. NBRC 105648]|uniref:EF-hand domain-containing protein n=1 Tax=Actinokineospora sp. NBRC 105648 TaxID=3032206 RepID=UPI0024A4854C|nr:EF-hand domain-containing protein [Actinokineospora sp. NBRC 105648]GLZ36568.1 calcium-binding protein [Actinokineospora sp. NBRC 105648]
MASRFQRDKVAAVFAAMDHDGDGVLTELDFIALAERWVRLRGCALGSPEHQRLTDVMLGWWETLRAAAGTEQVPLPAVLRVVDHLPEVPAAMAATAEAMFDAVDQDGDGRISAQEHTQLVEAWNGRPTPTDFPLLDLDGDGHLSRAEFTELWIQFWAGDDPEAPGTWVFGHFPRS